MTCSNNTGVIPDDLVGQEPGKMVTSRWLTTGLTVAIKYTRTKRPTKLLIRLFKVCLNLYFPGWFKFKTRLHIQNGATNFFYLIELSRDLPKEDMEIAHKVLQDNAHWAHSENIAIAMLADQRFGGSEKSCPQNYESQVRVVLQL